MAGRRSTRLAIAIPITINGKDANGRAFKEKSRTVVINKHGAKIATVHDLALGAEVSIENRALGRSAKGTVVWLGDRPSSKEPTEVGVQLAEAENVWGIEFAPEDWQEGPPTGPGGQRLEKAAAPEAPAAAEAPQATPAPAPPPAGGPALSPQQLGALGQASLEQLAKRAKETVEEQLRLFEQRLSKLSEQFGLQTQTTLQDSANALQEKIVQSLERQFSDMDQQLQGSRADIEALLNMLGELQRTTQEEAQRIQASIQAAGSDVPPASQVAFDEPSRQPQLTASVEKQINQITQASTAEFGEKLRTTAGDMAAKFREEMQKSLESVAGQMLSQTTQALEEKAHVASQNAEATLQQHIQQELESAQAAVAGKVSQTVGAALESINRAAEEGATRSQSAWQEMEGRAKAAAQEQSKRLADLSNSTLAELQRRSDAVLAGMAAQLEDTLASLREKGIRDLSEKLQQTSAELLATTAKDLQKRTAEAQQQLAGELQSVGKTVVGETRKLLETVSADFSAERLKVMKAGLLEEVKDQLEEISRDTLDALTREAQTLQKEYPIQVRKTIQDFQDQRTRELEDHLHKALEKQRQAILKQIQLVGEDASRKAEAHVKGECDRIIDASLGTLLKDVQGRLQQVTGALQDESLKATRKNLQEMADRLVADSTAQLHKQAEENLKLITEQLKASQEQAVNDAAESFRGRIAEMFLPGPKKPH
jgi:hypothetical protein